MARAVSMITFKDREDNKVFGLNGLISRDVLNEKFSNIVINSKLSNILNSFV